jgi:hypothetical protein
MYRLIIFAAMAVIPAAASQLYTRVTESFQGVSGAVTGTLAADIPVWLSAATALPATRASAAKTSSNILDFMYF